MGLLKSYYTAIHSGRGGQRLRKEAERVEAQINERIRMSFANEADWREWVLSTHERRWSNCDRCPLAQTADRVVMGEGAMEPLVAVITTAPGHEALLKKIFSKIGLDLSRHAYVTSMVACRPRIGRVPPRAYMEECRPRLQISLDILRPYVILLMGQGPLELLNDVDSENGVSAWRGKVPSLHWPTMDLRAKWNLKAVFVTDCPSTILAQHSKEGKAKVLNRIVADIRKVQRVVELLDSKVERSFVDSKETR